MTIFAIIIAIVLILSFIALTSWQRKNRWKQFTATLPFIIQLKSLIALLQRHRAMCATYLQGDAESLKTVNNLGSKITTLNAQLGDSASINEHQRWLGYVDHWQRLKTHATQLTVAKSFEQHVDLIANLLYLLEDMAEKQAFDKTTFEHIPHITLLWRELPLTVEYIGQSRAIGMAVTTAGNVTQVDKVKLGYLETKITQLTKDVLQQVKPSDSQNNQFINLASEACQSFTAIIRNELLAKEQVTITPSDYFNAATKAMDSIHRLLDKELEDLQQFLKTYH